MRCRTTLRRPLGRSVPAPDQLLDQRDHVGLAVGARQHKIGGARLKCRRQSTERRGIGVKLRGSLLRDLADRLVQRQFRKVRAARALILSSTSVMLRT